MTVFSMDEASAEQLRTIAAYADGHRIDLAEMQSRYDRFVNEGKVEDFSQEYQTLLPFGFKVVYTIEQHPMKDGSGGVWVRHMSMSSPAKGKAPIELTLQWVMGQLGFTTPLNDCMVYPEDIGPDHIAVNVLEPIRENAIAGSA